MLDIMYTREILKRNQTFTPISNQLAVLFEQALTELGEERLRTIFWKKEARTAAKIIGGIADAFEPMRNI